MASPDSKRQKLDVNSFGEMSTVSAKEDRGRQTDDGTITASSSNEEIVIVKKGAQTFEQVARLDGFVDRTKLIKELLDHAPDNVMILAPSKFGKTVNLNMLHLFYDIEDKNTKTKEDLAQKPKMEDLRSNPSKNMKVFLRQFNSKTYEESLILKEEDFVMEHFGRHPVIYFDFKECLPKCEAEAIFRCAMMVRRAYLENKYLDNSKEFQPDKIELKEACQDWCSYKRDDLKKLSLDDVRWGLQNLICSLKVHWGRDPVFLVDEVDKPCVAALRNKLSESQIYEIGSTISEVLCSILKVTKNEFRPAVALLTGICKFKNSGLSDIDNTVSTYFLNDFRFSKYYGMTAEEVEFLVKKIFASEGNDKIVAIINNINSRYNGYYQCPMSEEAEEENMVVQQSKHECARYCIFCVLSYMQWKNTYKKDPAKAFWSGEGFITQLVPVLKKSDSIMSAVQTLLYSDSGTFVINYQQEIDVHYLLGISREELVPNPDATLSFLLQRGLLTHALGKPIEKVIGGYNIHVRIPNVEIRDSYHRMFMDYQQELSDIKVPLSSCGAFFKSLPTENLVQNSTKFQQDLNELCVNLTRIFKYVKCQSEYSICAYILTILKLYGGYEKCEINYTVQYNDEDKGTHSYVYIDVVGIHGQFVLILEVKFNGACVGEPGKIGDRTKSSLAAAEDIVKLLPNKKFPENRQSAKAGTGKNLMLLKSKSCEGKKFLLMGMAVDGDGETHILAFPHTTDWEKVIQVNSEQHVVELISTHLKPK